ncbi:MAG TPA: TonB family protein [Acidobacteriaceae bacterium]
MTERNPEVRRPQTLETPGVSTGSSPSVTRADSGNHGIPGTESLHLNDRRPSGIRPLPTLPPGKDVSFTHFGILNAGEQSKATLFTSTAVNVVIAILICIIGAAAKKVHDQHVLLTTLTEPIPIKKQEDKPKPKPKIPEPPKVEMPKIEQPKLEMPKIQQVKVEMPKPPTPQIHMEVPLPVLAAAPRKVNAPAAPKLLNNLTQAAAVPNNDRHPSPVMVGTLNNPLKVDPNSRTTSKINMGNQGVPGMPAGNTGHGPVSLTGTMGSGAPNGSVNGRAHAATSIAGLSTGVPGGQGHARTTSAVNIAPMVSTPQATQAQRAAASGVRKELAVTSKPAARCTEDAKRNHIEGVVSVKANFLGRGGVQILGVVRSLGHGLDQEAQSVVQGIQFHPATVDGQPTDLTTVINVTFACSPQ